MKDEINEYIIGFCKCCNQCKAIKNGLCAECENRNNFRGMFNDFLGNSIFKGFNKNEH